VKLRPRIEAEPPKELRFRLDSETYQELELYGQLYAHEYGEVIDTPTLASEILRQFLAGDRAFKTWKRRRGNGADTDSEAAEASA
jgi:hypothetical protein